MRYHVTLDPSKDAPPIAVDVSQLPNGSLVVTVDGSPVDVDVVAVGERLSILVDGRVVDLTTEGVPPDVGCIAGGHRSYVRVESDRMLAAAAARRSSTTTSEKLLKSPMPGRIVRVLVAEGDEVEPGQPLVVVEAMKMENELKAPSAGTIAKVFVSEGATVEANAKLVGLA